MSDPVQVLLVDDDRNDIDIALRAVRREDLGVEVTVANGGGEALQALGLEPGYGNKEPLSPCVVFLDLKMPGVDGWEVLQKIRSAPATRALPVVILSWSAQTRDVERCYELGANSYLVKRFEPTRPGSYFADAVRYWVRVNEAPFPRD